MKCAICHKMLRRHPVYHEMLWYHQTCHRKEFPKQGKFGPSYAKFNRCTICCIWKPKDMIKCDECKTILRRTPRYSKGRKSIEVARI